MQQRKKIYERALKKLEKQLDLYICVAIYNSVKERDFDKAIQDCPEFILFKPGQLGVDNTWFDTQLEREICLDFCILFCNEKIFDNA
jgi:hypothetical protein